jgi:hypothetical protein
MRIVAMIRDYMGAMRMVLATSIVVLVGLISSQPRRAVAGVRHQGQTHVHRRHFRKSGLLTGIATKVADTRDWNLTDYVMEYQHVASVGTYAWLDDHRLLFFRKSGRNRAHAQTKALANFSNPSPSIELDLFDTRARTRTAQTALQRAFNRSQGIATWLKPSPNGKVLAWPNVFGDVVVASLDGKAVYPVKESTTGSDDVIHQGDSMQWLWPSRQFVILSFTEDRLVGAALRSGPKYQRDKWLGCALFESIHLMSATLVHNTDLHCIIGMDHENNVAFVSTSLSNNDPQQLHWTSVRLPPIEELEDARPNRHGDRIAWMLRQRLASSQSKRGRLVISVWISDARGKHMREIGWLPVSPNENGPLEFSRLRWKPDDRHLSFIYHDALYVVPAR